MFENISFSSHWFLIGSFAYFLLIFICILLYTVYLILTGWIAKLRNQWEVHEKKEGMIKIGFSMLLLIFNVPLLYIGILMLFYSLNK